MKTFNNLNVGAKIIGTLAIILGLTLLIAGLGLYFLNGMNGRLNNIVDVTAEEIKLAAAINRGLVEVGRAEKNMLLADTQEDMDVYATPIALLNDDLTNDLTRLQALTDAEGVARLEQFQAAYDEYLGINSQVRSLIRQNSARRAFLLAFGQGRDLFDRLEAELDELVQKLEADMSAAERSEDFQILRDAAEKTILVARLKQNLLTISRAEKNLILAKTAQNQEAAAASLDREQAQMQQRRAQLRERVDRQEQALLDQVTTTYNEWLQIHNEVRELAVANSNQKAITLSQGDGREKFDQAANHIQAIVVKNDADLATDKELSDRNFSSTRNILLSVSGASIIFGLVLGVVVSRGITTNLGLVVRAADAIAGGDVDQKVAVKSNDEIGELAAAFQRMIAYLQEMADAAGRLAEGDLITRITPRSDRDALGIAFEQMVGDLRNLIGQVQQGAEQVASASLQLNATAEQAGLAGQQVATTIQQVAQGTTQQTDSVNEATGNVEQMARAADGVARGSQEQAQSVQTTSNLVGEMANIVSQVGQVADRVSEANTQVTQVARHGVTTVQQAGQGMETIHSQTKAAAGKVREMEARSTEIGRIVETIDEIADKTDMLALNAAVEAARAGEHGHGFAVVADQVRKLSEDSKEATADIAALIERVRRTVNEAIAAMDNTVTEVAQGAQLAADTAQALQEILQSAEAADSLAERIDEAMGQLKQKSESVVEASESVSAVVEENTAAAEEMSANSQEITTAMEGVASVAEENSAAAEQVSASAEEMSAQVEEVVASAQALSSLASQLRAAAGQFQVEQIGWNGPTRLADNHLAIPPESTGQKPEAHVMVPVDQPGNDYGPDPVPSPHPNGP